MTSRMTKSLLHQLLNTNKCIYGIRYETIVAAVPDTSEDLANAKPFEEIPGDLRLPFVGTAWTFFPYIGKYTANKLHEASIKKYKEYGPIVRDNLTGLRKTVLLFDPKDIEKVARNEGVYPSRPGVEFLVTYRKLRPQWYKTGGLGVLTGKEWHDFRTKVQQVMLRPKSVIKYLEQMDEVAEDMIKRMNLLKDSTGEIPDLWGEIYKWSLESLASMAFDKRLGCLESKLEDGSEAMEMIKAVRGTFQGMTNMLFSPLELWKYFPTKSWKMFEKAHDDFAKIAIKYVKIAIRDIQNNQEEDREMNFIQTLLASRDIDSRDAVTMLLDMLLAGVDTTSNSISFALYFLAKHPEVQEKAHKEIASMLSKGEPLTQKITNDLHYIKACIKESMRLIPTTNGTVRALDHDIVLSGYRVPAGIPLWFQNLVACRQEWYFPRADKYLPERWLNDKLHHPFLFLPFGYGRRMCIGRRIAEQEMLLLIAKTIQNFHIEYNYEPIGCNTGVVNVPDKPLRYQFYNR